VGSGKEAVVTLGQQGVHDLAASILQIDDALALLPEDEQQAYRDAQQSVIDARRHAEANEGMRMIW
jgi:hypothetical protein